MKLNRWPLAAVLLATLVSMLACGGSFSTANIQRAWLSSDSSGSPETTEFSQDETFYCLAELANASDETMLKAVWTAISAEGTDPNFLIDESELTTGDGTVTFNLNNDQLWPVGTYKVDLYLNGELDRALTFEVR